MFVTVDNDQVSCAKLRILLNAQLSSSNEQKHFAKQNIVTYLCLIFVNFVAQEKANSSSQQEQNWNDCQSCNQSRLIS